MYFVDDWFGGFPGFTPIVKDRFYIGVEGSDVGVFLESLEESHTGQSVLKACLALLMRSSTSSSAPPAVLMLLQVYRLGHAFHGLLLDHNRLVGFGVEHHGLGLPNIYPESYLLTVFSMLYFPGALPRFSFLLALLISSKDILPQWSFSASSVWGQSIEDFFTVSSSCVAV